MIISHTYQETQAQKDKRKYIASLKKAKHLSSRMHAFVVDIEKSKMKEKDKKSIIAEAVKFLNDLINE